MSDGLGLYWAEDSKGIHWHIEEGWSGKWRWVKFGNKTVESPRYYDSVEEAKKSAEAYGQDSEVYLALFRSASEG